MRTALLGILAIGCSFAQSNLRVLGTTATQAAVAYTEPDATACTIAVSQTADSAGNPTAPLVPDVDPAVFAGSNLDSRADNVTVGRSQTFIIGKRSAQAAASGLYVSRSLQANTPYYGKITCGASAALFQFQTTNIPLGLGASDPWPADPANPGELAVPSTAGSIGETLVDPLTGSQVVRLTYPGIGWSQQTNQAFDTAYDQSQQPCDSAGPWTNPCNAVGNTAPATVGNSTGWLVLRPNNISFGWGGTDATFGQLLTQFQFSAAASSSQAGQSLDVCLSMNAGASCASPILNVALPTSTGTITAGMNNPGAVGYDSWIFQSKPHISRWEASTLQGTLSVAGTTATWQTTTSGGNTYFSNAWALGRIRLSTVSAPAACSSGTDIGIVSGGGKTLTLSSAPGNGTYYYCAPNFAVMVRRHDASAGGTVSIQNAKWTSTRSDAGENSGSGDSNICASGLVANGFLCFVPGGGGSGYLGWTNPVTGSTNLMGALYSGAKGSGANTWSSQTCPATGPVAFSTIDDTVSSPPTWYCVANDGTGKVIILQVQYTGSLNAQGFADGAAIGSGCSVTDDYTVTCSNVVIKDLTPSSLNQDVRAQMLAFSGQAVDGAMAFHHGPVQNGKFLIYAYYGQNTAAWFAVFDPGDRNPAHAGQAGGPRIIATASSLGGAAGASNRWGEVHAVMDYGCCSGYFGWSGSPINSGSNTVGNTAIQVTTGTSFSTASTSCPSGVTGSCLLLQINQNSGSYEPYYWTSVGSQGTAPGVPNTAGVGDLLCASPSQTCCRPNLGAACSGQATTNETVRIVQKSANGQWIVQRNAAQQAPVSYPNLSGTTYLTFLSGAISTGFKWPGLSTANSNGMLGGGVYWDYANDPYGQRATSDPQFFDNHSCWRPMVGLESENWPISPYPSVYRSRHADNFEDLWQAPINVITSNPGFNGIDGPAGSNVWQSHPSAPPNNASAYESQSVYDFRPLEGFYSTAPSNADLYSNVSGQLWKAVYTATTPDVLSGSSIGLHRKIYATAASSGIHPLTDVSGPGSGIDGTAANSYKYCIARLDGECYAGSRAGEIYVNAPGVVFPFCQGNNTSGQTQPAANDICISDMPPLGESLVQASTIRPDFAGWYQRALVKSLIGRVKAATGTGGLMALPDGWVGYNANYIDNLGRANYAVKLPPFPALDSISRTGFVAIPVSLTPPSGVNNAIVEFGYPDFHGNCTTRNEACVANASTINSVPFQFAGENPAGAPCAATCTIVIPAMSQRMLYYRVKYRDAANAVLSTTPYQVLVTP